jgi:hypothetical protein
MTLDQLLEILEREDLPGDTHVTICPAPDIYLSISQVRLLCAGDKIALVLARDQIIPKRSTDDSL